MAPKAKGLDPRSAQRAKPKFRVGQVVWEKEDGAYVRIVKMSKHGDLLQVDRFGNRWNVQPQNIRPLTKREAGR